jgi:hypothetical protein
MVLRTLLANPGAILWNNWNWKSAVTSSVLRAHLFLAANLSAGWRPAVAAGLAELLFRFVASGFYGGLTQLFRRVNPAWAGAATVTVLLPAVSHSIELLVHWLRGTPNLRTSITVSVCFTAVSTTFNWFAMRRGLLLVGKNQESLWADLRRMAALLFEIAISVCRWTIRRGSKLRAPGVSRTV